MFPGQIVMHFTLVELNFFDEAYICTSINLHFLLFIHIDVIWSEFKSFLLEDNNTFILHCQLLLMSYANKINSLTLERFDWNFKQQIFNLNFGISGWGISLEIDLRWKSEGLTIDNIGMIGSGNGLVPSGKKPLPDPMFTQICVTIWHP